MLEEALLLLQMSTMVQVSTNLQPAALPRALPGSVVVGPLPIVPVVVVDVPSPHFSFVTHTLWRQLDEELDRSCSLEEELEEELEGSDLIELGLEELEEGEPRTKEELLEVAEDEELEAIVEDEDEETLEDEEEDGTLEVSMEPEDDEEQDDIPALDVELERDVLLLLEEELPRLEDTLLLLQMSTILQTSTCLQPVLVIVVVVVVSGVVLAVVSSALVVTAASAVWVLPRALVLPKALPKALPNVVFVVPVVSSLQSSSMVHTC